jgi:transposase-like protein
MIMGKAQKIWPNEFKVEVVLAILRGEASAAELARQHGIHESLIHKWKRQFLEAGRASFADGRSVNAKELRLEKENERLKQLLGEKVIELDIAKKREDSEAHRAC